MPEVRRAKTVYCEPLKEWVTLVAYDDGAVKCPAFEKRKQGKEGAEEVKKAVGALIEDYEALIRAEKGKA